MYLRSRLKQRVRFETLNGFIEHGQIKPATVHQEFRVLRRVLNVAVRKKLISANPCWGVEFPIRLKGLFRPHYVTWSEQQPIEFHAPVYLANAIRIITETGLRVYRELTPMRKDQIDLANKIVWIPDSKTANGVAEVPLTDEAVQAFEKSDAGGRRGTVALPEQRQSERPSERVQDGLACDFASPSSRIFGSTICARPMQPHFLLAASQTSGSRSCSTG
jgi:integrase